jgi:hypothetical protein
MLKKWTTLYYLDGKAIELEHGYLDQIDHPNSELNTCCFVMYVNCYQTIFWSVQSRIHFYI